MLPLVLVALASAAEPHIEPAGAVPESAHHQTDRVPHTIIATKMIGGVAMHDHHTSPVAGVGLFLEQVAIEHVLEIELALAWVRHDGHDYVPVDVLLKTPVWHHEDLELHAGVGVAVAVPLHKHADLHYGLLATADLFHWWRPTFGGMLEVCAQELLSKHGPTTDLEVAVGFATRF